MKARISFLLIILTLIINIAGCGNNELGAEPSVSSEDVISDNTMSDNEISANALSEDSVSEEKIDYKNLVEMPEVPYFEDYAFKFAKNQSYKIPFAVYLSDENFSKIIGVPGVTIEEPLMETYIKSVSVSDVDEEGFVDLRITVKTKLEFSISENDALYDNSFYSYSVHKSDYILADYYTGAILTGHNPNNSKQKYEVNIKSISDNDLIYNVKVKQTQKWKWDDHNWKIIERTAPVYLLPVSATVTDKYTIHMPEDYDGLVIYINNAGISKYNQDDLDKFKKGLGEEEMRYVLEYDPVEKIDCIRVNDLIGLNLE